MLIEIGEFGFSKYVREICGVFRIQVKADGTRGKE